MILQWSYLHHMNNYKFSIDFWNEDHVRNFLRIKTEFDWPCHAKFLEIGTFEGRTATWLLDNIDSCKLTLVDPDPGPNFHNNLDPHLNKNNSRVTWKKIYSHEFLKTIWLTDHRYDLIYIDGSHNASNVLEDAILAWRVLKNKGILLFDDYLMEIKDGWFYISHPEFIQYKDNGLMWHHPKEAIDAFMNIYKGQYVTWIDNYQIGLRKICEISTKNLNHGNDQKVLYENK